MITSLKPEDLISAAAAILYLYEPDGGRVLFQNHRLGKILGYDEAEWPGADAEWPHYMHEEDAQRFSEHLAELKALAPGTSTSWEYRLKDGTGRWRWFISHNKLLASAPDGQAAYIVGTASEITAQKEAEEQTRILLLEMRHRSKNFSAVIDGIARQMKRGLTPDGAAAIDSLAGRLRALLSAGDAALASQDRLSDFSIVAAQALAPFAGVGGGIHMKGPQLIVPEAAAGALALALHELATNALKYGALSRPGGSVALTWTAGERSSVEWREQGGPGAVPPEREGFGTRLIKNAAAQSPNGTVELSYEPTGLRCRFAFSGSAP
ncbi:MAG TPA: PAS domain-containing protein [Rhizomicrobium sp.]|jgi:PAS domain S-box-containing protein|nr:PAS domain-containing protein [Rhizomicrobium sp.]